MCVTRTSTATASGPQTVRGRKRGEDRRKWEREDCKCARKKGKENKRALPPLPGLKTKGAQQSQPLSEPAKSQSSPAPQQDYLKSPGEKKTCVRMVKTDVLPAPDQTATIRYSPFPNSATNTFPPFRNAVHRFLCAFEPGMLDQQSNRLKCFWA